MTKQGSKRIIWLVLLATLSTMFMGPYIYSYFEVRRAESEFPPIGQFVAVEGLRLHYVSEGSGKPIVMLHGNAGFLQDYSMTILERVAQEYHAFAFDRPGHGYSERPAEEVTTAEVQARLLHGALRELGIEKPVLVGHSWGGALALVYSVQYAEEISGLVLLGAAAYPVGTQPSPLDNITQIPVLGDLLLSILGVPAARLLGYPDLTSAFSPDPVPTDYLKAARALWPRPRQAKAIAQDNATISSTLRALSTQYGEIRVPVVIVIGDSDLLVKSEQHAYPLHQTIVHSRLIVLPNTGHEIPHTRSEAVIDAIHIVWEQVLP